MSWFRRRRCTEPLAAALGAVELRRPWIRPDAARPDQAGGYLAITHKAAAPDRLLTAASPKAAAIEIHGIRVIGGDIAMRHLPEGLVLPPASAITLQPRGYHLLLKDVQGPLAAGSRVPVALSFERAGTIEILFLVEEAGLVGEAILDEDRHRP
ncbi:MAG: copper chaperone PCu(A)C [Pseudomonadota bacterium]